MQSRNKKKSPRRKFPEEKEKSLAEISFNRAKEKFQWSLEKCEWDDKGWGSDKVRDLKSFADNIIGKLKCYETQTWGEVESASGGKSNGHGNNNHFINGVDLPKEYKRVFIEKHYMEEYEAVFSLRLSGPERLFGVVDMAKFYVLWYDPKHSFFPSKKG